MAKLQLQNIIGLAGVASDERESARRWAHHFEAPMLLLALWILIEWYAQANGSLPASITVWTNWVIWLFFIFETAILTVLVEDKRRFLRSNWINLVIIIMGASILWGETNYAGILRSLRLLLMLSLILNVSDTVQQILARNNLGTTLLVAFVFIIFSGIFIAGIDPAIDTLWEGIWWAWVTVTTVGYGDIVPSSVAGKLFGAVLILLGIGLFSLLTANFSAFFINKEEKISFEAEDRELSKMTRRIELRLAAIEKRMDSIHRQLEKPVVETAQNNSRQTNSKTPNGE